MSVIEILLLFVTVVAAAPQYARGGDTTFTEVVYYELLQEQMNNTAFTPATGLFNHTISGLLNCTQTGEVSHVCKVPCGPGKNTTDMNSTCNFMASRILNQTAAIHVNVSALTGYQINCTASGCNMTCGTKGEECRLNGTTSFNVTEWLQPPNEEEDSGLDAFLANTIGQFGDWFAEL